MKRRSLALIVSVVLCGAAVVARAADQPSPADPIREAPARLDGTAVVNRAIGCFPRFDVELTQEASEADPGSLVANANANRPVFVVNAYGDDGALEPRVRHSRHREEELAGEETGLFDHARDNERRKCDGQGLRAPYGEPICRFNATRGDRQ